MGAFREVLLQKRGGGHSWQTAQPKQRQESGKALPARWAMGRWQGCHRMLKPHGRLARVLPASMTLRSNLTLDEPAMTA